MLTELTEGWCRGESHPESFGCVLAQRRAHLRVAGAAQLPLLLHRTLLSNIGTWMQRTSQDWLVLTQLTDRSSSALGIVSALQFLAIPFLAPFSGAVADRYPKRTILLITQTLLENQLCPPVAAGGHQQRGAVACLRVRLRPGRCRELRHAGASGLRL